MKLVAILRVKNAKDTIEDCLTRLEDLCDEIVIVDNGSTDGTKKIYQQFSKIIEVKETKGFNEGRDKRLLLSMAKKRNPNWILWTDADEVFEEISSRKTLEKYMNNSRINLVKFRLFHFWLSDVFYRTDGVWKKYTAFPQRMMWRNLDSAYFRDLKFHSGGIMGLPRKRITSHLRLKHYGYRNKQQVTEKYNFYKSMDDDPMSSKTLYLDPENKNITLKKWRSDIVYSYKDWIKWEIFQKIISITQLIKTRI